ncbi:selenoprotein J [Triplophysa rosa]|uniref:Selenoprotein J n=1 Tax=Triplophysa rosa TaxID=992332 RepID=A0A9W7WWU1_TRIRA|nr:selenoprotein J [Triplophysa rosa]
MYNNACTIRRVVTCILCPISSTEVGSQQTLPRELSLCNWRTSDSVIKVLPTKMALAQAERAIGAIIGAAVGDSAAQPLHWVYDLQKLSVLLSEMPQPEFWPQSANPFYRRNTGQQSCYGDQAFVLLESLSESGGLSVDDLQQRTYRFFGPGSEYDTPLNDPYRDKGAPRPQLPIEGPWRQASLKSFIKNVDAGKAETDNQIDGVAKLAPVVACYAGKPEMLERVEEVIRVTQNNDMCVTVTLAAARFLEHFILNGPDPKAMEAVLEQLSDPNRSNPQELDKAIIETQRAHSCCLPGAFQAALHGVLTAKSYEQAIRDTMSCGGCTCSRSSFIGACIGAQVGLEGIPSTWRSKTLRYNTLLDLAKKVVSPL